MQSCGECTLCCKMLEIPEVDSKFNEWCQHCNKSGCKIYPDRPEGCRNFNCVWLQMDKVGIEMRPDKCGVVFEKFTDSVIVGVGDGRMSDLVQGQIRFFNREGISVVLLDHSSKGKITYLASGHTRNFVERQINDSSELHGRPD